MCIAICYVCSSAYGAAWWWLQVNHVPISKGHHYLSASTREPGGNLKPRTVRVAKEIAGLEKDLAGGQGVWGWMFRVCVDAHCVHCTCALCCLCV